MNALPIDAAVNTGSPKGSDAIVFPAAGTTTDANILDFNFSSDLAAALASGELAPAASSSNDAGAAPAQSIASAKKGVLDSKSGAADKLHTDSNIVPVAVPTRILDVGKSPRAIAVFAGSVRGDRTKQFAPLRARAANADTITRVPELGLAMQMQIRLPDASESPHRAGLPVRGAENSGAIAIAAVTTSPDSSQAASPSSVRTSIQEKVADANIGVVAEAMPAPARESASPFAVERPPHDHPQIETAVLSAAIASPVQEPSLSSHAVQSKSNSASRASVTPAAAASSHPEKQLDHPGDAAKRSAQRVNTAPSREDRPAEVSVRVTRGEQPASDSPKFAPLRAQRPAQTEAQPIGQTQLAQPMARPIEQPQHSQPVVHSMEQSQHAQPAAQLVLTSAAAERPAARADHAAEIPAPRSAPEPVVSHRSAMLRVDLGDGGTARATVREHAGSVQVRVMSPSAPVARTIAREIDSLRTALEGTGLKLVRAEIAHDSAGRGDGGKHSAPERPPRDGARAEADNGAQLFEIDEVEN
jgi:hypothetical protein